MGLFKVCHPRWWIYALVSLGLIALVACGTSAPAPAAPAAAPAAESAAPASQPAAAPQQPAQQQQPAAAAAQPAAPAAPTATPAPVSAEVGQGAIGAGAVAPTPVPTAVPAAAVETPAEPAVIRVEVARGPTTWDLVDPVAGRGDLPIILPLFEGLVQFDQYTDSVPMLSPEWTTNDDFTVWTFQLREGVQFHKGWGEMTAKDIAHTMSQERRLDHNDSRAGTWRDLLKEVVMPDGPDGHVVELHRRAFGV